jgi:hypothetical protein
MENEVQPTIKKAPLTLDSVKSMLTSQPQVRELLIKLAAFWEVNGYKVKIGLGVLSVLVVVLVAVRIGQNIAALNRPQQALPSAIPTVQPTKAVLKTSSFDGLREQVKNFKEFFEALICYAKEVEKRGGN